MTVAEAGLGLRGFPATSVTPRCLGRTGRCGLVLKWVGLGMIWTMETGQGRRGKTLDRAHAGRE